MRVHHPSIPHMLALVAGLMCSADAARAQPVPNGRSLKASQIRMDAITRYFELRQTFSPTSRILSSGTTLPPCDTGMMLCTVPLVVVDIYLKDDPTPAGCAIQVPEVHITPADKDKKTKIVWELPAGSTNLQFDLRGGIVVVSDKKGGVDVKKIQTSKTQVWTVHSHKGKSKDHEVTYLPFVFRDLDDPNKAVLCFAGDPKIIND